MSKFYTFYDRPKSVNTVLDYETKFVSQSEADMCGLKYQIERYGMDGLQARFEQMKDKFGYADTTIIPNFAELQNRIVAGRNYFEALPSEIRKQFGHKPENYFAYLEEHPKESIEKGFINDEQAKILKEKYNLGVGEVVQPVDPVQPVESPVNSDVVVENKEVSA